jgi:hypothetical protein
MPVKTVELDDGDEKAKSLIVQSLFVCAHDHTLSKKLLDRFPAALGRKLVIVGDWFDLSQMVDYDYTALPPEGTDASGERPVERVVAFVRQYLQAAERGIVVSENWDGNVSTSVNCSGARHVLPASGTMRSITS